MNEALPILWSFRRCPYAMRARLALASSGIRYEHREILLRDKPAAFLASSPKGTVPVVVDGDDVIEESLDIMQWALAQNDPENWLDVPQAAHDLIVTCDGPFKTSLDRYKYSSRIADAKAETDRDEAGKFLTLLDALLCDRRYLNGHQVRLPDMAIATFVRQFAHVDLDWFNAQPWPNLIRWLDDFKSSDRFLSIMQKHAIWKPAPDESCATAPETS